jgi:hypothetical protein
LNVSPRHGGPRVRRRKTKDGQQMVGALIAEADYFFDDSGHTTKDFRRRFRMNKELFMHIVYGVREYDD